MKISPVGAEFFLSDGQTDRPDEADIRSSQFCNVPKKEEKRNFACLSILT
jgi:hypothetical protein